MARVCIDITHVYRDSVVNVGRANSIVPKDWSAELKRTVEYFSNTTETLYVGTRDGLVVSPKYTMVPNGRNGLYVRVTYSGKYDTMNKLKDSLSSVDDDSGEELLIIKQAFNMPTQDNVDRYSTVVEYFIPLDAIQKREGNLYQPQLDITISTHANSKQARHPYTTEGRLDRLLYQDLNDIRDCCLIFLRIIDNQGIYGRYMYINLEGVPYRVPIIQDTSFDSGVYMSHTGKNVAATEVDNAKLDWWPIEECLHGQNPKHGIVLYPDLNTAVSGGNASARVERELKEMDERNRKAKFEWDAEKIKLEREAAEAKRSALELEDELKRARRRIEDERERNSYRRKDEYEERSSKRRDRTETIKTISVILTTGIALGMAVMKFLERPKS